jgi:hypothetical protein
LRRRIADQQAHGSNSPPFTLATFALPLFSSVGVMAWEVGLPLLVPRLKA